MNTDKRASYPLPCEVTMSASSTTLVIWLCLLATVSACTGTPREPTTAAPVNVDYDMPPNSVFLLFDFDSAEIRPDFLSILRYEASIWAKAPAKLLVSSHTDRAGTDAYNLELSKHRCMVVRDALVSFGIDPRLLVLWPRGESATAVPTPDGVKELANRFVRIQYCEFEKERPAACD